MSKISRRDVLVSSVSAGAAASIAAVTGAILADNQTNDALRAMEATNATAVRDASVPFFGAHQAGVELELQTFTNFIAFDLDPSTDLAAFRRWMSLLTDDISRLVRGKPVLADAQPQLAMGPARLTATVGISPEFFGKLGIQRLKPSNFNQVPSLKIDDLKDEFSLGDVLLHVSADDPIVLSHAVRALIRDSLAFGQVRWSQQGFSNAQGVVPGGVRQRNLMGQVDGTENPEFGSSDFDRIVWIDADSAEQPWTVGGTQMVLRRIRMNLDTWDKLGRVDKEMIIGRDLTVGAPLGKAKETDVPDFAARRPNGLLEIPAFAHIRHAHPQNPLERFFRRPFNFEVGVSPNGSPDVGLLWAAYARDLANQYLPVQERLAKVDVLNLWTTPIGSSVWFILPGVSAPDQILGQSLLEAAERA